MELPKRKPTRLPSCDYSTTGAYFITICTQDRKNLFGAIVGGGDLDAPQMQLTPLGKIVEKYIVSGDKAEGIRVDKFAVMPNHLHMILFVCGNYESATKANERIPHFVSTYKRFCYRSAGFKFFQRGYHDHVIRNEADYQRIWQYIDNNPASWQEDCFYTE